MSMTTLVLVNVWLGAALLGGLALLVRAAHGLRDHAAGRTPSTLTVFHTSDPYEEERLAA